MKPFDLDDNLAYQEWRRAKLQNYPTRPDQLAVNIADPEQLTTDEKNRLSAIIAKTNMALYVTGIGDMADKGLVKSLAEQLGLHRMEANLCADNDAFSSLEATHGENRSGYIPYTNRPITWHTDGYYNAQQNQIRGMLLHCVRPAAHGGMNQLLDHEIVYIQLRDENPNYVRALMTKDVMTIPANIIDGKELRPEVSGPVFSTDSDGNLHMRYTHRKRNIHWTEDPLTREALTFLNTLLNKANPYCFEATLRSGEGLICNNVLHTRTGFEEGSKRLLYRGRYFDRIRL